MECANGYKSNYEIKQKHLFVRMDDSMIEKLQAIKKKSGISVSEIIRESVRRLFQEADESGSINLKVN